jgi:hypothetical protein
VTRLRCAPKMTVIVKRYQMAQMAQGWQIDHRFF